VNVKVVEQGDDLLQRDDAVPQAVLQRPFLSALEASILERIRTATGRAVTATSEAIVAALRTLGARRIVMLSPYIDEINRRETAYFREHGFEVLGCAGLDRATPQEMMAVKGTGRLATVSAAKA
jgi:maleate cis-trans isomerase